MEEEEEPEPIQLDEGKKRYLFWDYPQWKSLKVDDVALYSVTPCKYAFQIARIIRSFMRKKENATVCDATACVGGDTLALSQEFRNVIAIENNASRYAMLCHNLNLVMNEEKNVTTICDDFVHWWETSDTTEEINAVYIDPPWEQDCRLSGYSIWDVASTIKSKGKLVALKLPCDMEIEMVTKKISTLKNAKGEAKMKIVII